MALARYSGPFRRVQTRLVRGLTRLSSRLLRMFLSSTTGVSTRSVRTTIEELAVTNGVIPILYKSSFQGVKMRPLLSTIVRCLPHPSRHPPPVLRSPSNLTLSITVSSGSLLTLTFGIVRSRRQNLLIFLHICSKGVNTGAILQGGGRSIGRHPAHLFHVRTGHFRRVGRTATNDIIILLNLGGAHANSALARFSSHRTRGILLRDVCTPRPMFAYSMRTRSGDSRTRLSRTLEVVRLRSPSMQPDQSPRANRQRLSKVNRLRLRVIKHHVAQSLGTGTVFKRIRVTRGRILANLPSAMLARSVSLRVNKQEVITNLKLGLRSVLRRGGYPPSRVEVRTLLPDTRKLRRTVRRNVVKTLGSNPLTRLPLISVIVAIRRYG